ncbi:MAG: hypothetical protein ABIJ08_03650, partial [Nanoarchaeota archaeon]
VVTTCDFDLTCDLDESCACSDCFNTQDSCTTGAICSAATQACACQAGMQLCQDGTCSYNCTLTDTGVLPTCNNDGVCDSDESCGCADCDAEQDSCASGAICSATTQSCVCQAGMQLCLDGTCSYNCSLTDTGVVTTCDFDLTCDLDESCACSDCFNTQDSCTTGAICSAATQACACQAGMQLCLDGTCSYNCTLTDTGVNLVCNDDSICNLNESCACNDCFANQDSCAQGSICSNTTQSCVCPAGTQLCSDGTCSYNCTLTDNGPHPICNFDTICDLNESCNCSDCYGQQDTCIDNSVCSSTTLRCACLGGMQLCADGTCSYNCFITDTGPALTCNNDGTCDLNESCACNDCNTLQDSCQNGAICDFVTQSCTTSDIIEPTWDMIPPNVTLEYLVDPLQVDFNATDNVLLDQFFINDTINFKIDVNGNLENNTILPLGIYDINVSVNDTSGNVRSLIFRVNVTDTLPPVILSTTPTGTLNTNTVTIVVVTNEDAMCRYTEAPSGNTSVLYSDMSSNFTDNMTDHTVTLSLTNGNYEYYIRCNDTQGNVMVSSVNLTFTVAVSSAPVSTGGGGVDQLGRRRQIDGGGIYNYTASIKIINPGPISVPTLGEVAVPILFENDGQISLRNISISVQSNIINATLRLSLDIIEELFVNKTTRVILYIKSDSYEPFGRFDTLIDLDVEAPSLADRAMTYIDVIDSYADIKDKLRADIASARDFMNQHIECKDFLAFLDEAEDNINNYEFERSSAVIKGAVQACEDAIKPPKLPNIIIEKGADILLAGVIILILLLIGTLLYYGLRRARILEHAEEEFKEFSAVLMTDLNEKHVEELLGHYRALLNAYLHVRSASIPMAKKQTYYQQIKSMHDKTVDFVEKGREHLLEGEFDNFASSLRKDMTEHHIAELKVHYRSLINSYLKIRKEPMSNTKKREYYNQLRKIHDKIIHTIQRK